MHESPGSPPTGTLHLRRFEARVIDWMRAKTDLSTEHRPETDTGNYSGRGIVWGWQASSPVARRIAHAGLLLVTAAAILGMAAGRYRDPGIGAFGVAGIATALAGLALFVASSRRARRDRSYVAVAYQAEGIVRLPAIWAAADQAWQQAQAAGREPNHALWIVAGPSGFTPRAEAGGRRLGYRLFRADEDAIREVGLHAHTEPREPAPAGTTTLGRRRAS